MGHHEDNPWAKEAEDNASRGRRSDIENMKWTVGERTIRVCPPIEKGGLPFVKYIVHRQSISYFQCQIVYLYSR